MKKLIAATLFAGLSVSAFAADCANPIAPLSTPVKCTVKAAAEPKFIKIDFDFQPSSGIGIGYFEEAAGVSVLAGNVKGKFVYGGSSNGGSVKQCQTAASDVDTTKGIAGVPTSVETPCPAAAS